MGFDIQEAIRKNGERLQREGLERVEADFRDRVGAPGPAPTRVPVNRAPYEMGGAYTPPEPSLADQEAVYTGNDVDPHGIWGKNFRQNLIDGIGPTILPRGKGATKDGGDGNEDGDYTPDPKGSGRGDSRVSKTGVKQKGTNMGPRIATFDELMAYGGGNVRDMAGMFTSEALPTTGTAAAKIDPQNYLVNGEQTPADQMDPLDVFSMQHSSGKLDPKFLAGFAPKTGTANEMLDYATNKGWSATGLGPSEQMPPGNYEQAQGDFKKFYQRGQAEGKGNQKAGPSKVVKGFNGAEFGGDYGEDYSTGRSAKEELAKARFLSGEGHIMDRFRDLEASRGYVHTHAGKMARFGDEFKKLTDEGVQAFKTGKIDPSKKASYIDDSWGKPLTDKSAGGNTPPEESTANPSAVQVPDFVKDSTVSAISSGAEASKAAKGFAQNYMDKVKGAMNGETEMPGAQDIVSGANFTTKEDWSRNNTMPIEVED